MAVAVLLPRLQLSRVVEVSTVLCGGAPMPLPAVWRPALTHFARFQSRRRESEPQRARPHCHHRPLRATAFLLHTRSAKYVMRKKPPGKLMSKTAHAVEREFKVLQALAPTAVPVPRAHVLCTDTSVVGTPFFVMEYVSGRIFTDPALEGVSREHRAACYASVVETLVAIHGVDPRAVGLGDFGRFGGFYPRQIKTLSKVSAAQAAAAAKALEVSGALKPGDDVEALVGIPRFADMRAWLEAHMPPDEVSLIHGDYKVDNLVFHPTEPRVIAVLDWELSTIGHPMADLANLCQSYYAPRSAISAGVALGLQGLDLDELGIPDETDVLRMYNAGTGRHAGGDRGAAAGAGAAGTAPGAGALSDGRSSWEFFMAFFFWKYTVIGQGILARAITGVASSAGANADKTRQFIRVLVAMAETKMPGLQDCSARARL